MKTTIAIVMLAAGIGLLIWGYNLSEGFDSKVSRAFTGSSTDKAMWAMIGGAVLAIAGAVQLFIGRK